MLELNHMKLDDWDRMWVNNTFTGDRSKVNADIVKMRELLFRGKNGMPSRVFFPWCGSTVDMKYVADQGHAVVGLEINDKAITDFFRVQEIEYKWVVLARLNLALISTSILLLLAVVAAALYS